MYGIVESQRSNGSREGSAIEQAEVFLRAEDERRETVIRVRVARRDDLTCCFGSVPAPDEGIADEGSGNV